mmetsp:Transcript_15053/g.43393  ORF Transcript_15053/g.43393 Transcript_15053/m.43393 type:complete len:247 (-) Transcript_15053:299-1039(-)
MSLGLTISTQQGKCHKPIAFCKLTFAIRPLLFKGNGIFSRHIELIARNETFRRQCIDAIGLYVLSPSIDRFGNRFWHNRLDQQSVVKGGSRGASQYERRIDHGAQKGTNGGPSMRFLEGFSRSPGTKIRFLVPNGKADHISLGRGIIRSFVVGRSSSSTSASTAAVVVVLQSHTSHQMKIFESRKSRQFGLSSRPTLFEFGSFALTDGKTIRSDITISFQQAIRGGRRHCCFFILVSSCCFSCGSK